jgi:micrococcal nuclease
MAVSSRLRSFALGAATLAALLPSIAAAQQAPATFASVVSVVGGDTVDVQLDTGTREHVRLIGMDTPETVDPSQPMPCFSQEASTRAHELLDGQNVRVEMDTSQGERDKYGRLFAYLFLSDGTNFAQEMIGEGYAHEYTYRQPYTYQSDFVAAQDWARANGLGLWAQDTCAGQAYPSDLDDGTEPPAGLPQAPAPAPPAQPKPAPQPAQPAAPQPATPVGFDPRAYIHNGDAYNCGAFKSQAEAQAVLRADPTDPNLLDVDQDGIACESNPAPKDLNKVPR